MRVHINLTGLTFCEGLPCSRVARVGRQLRADIVNVGLEPKSFTMAVLSILAARNGSDGGSRSSNPERRISNRFMTGRNHVTGVPSRFGVAFDVFNKPLTFPSLHQAGVSVSLVSSFAQVCPP